MIKKTSRTRAQAKKLMWDYYRENREWLPKWIQEFREEVLEDLIKGHEPDNTFRKMIIEVEDTAA